MLLTLGCVQFLYRCPDWKQQLQNACVVRWLMVGVWRQVGCVMFVATTSCLKAFHFFQGSSSGPASQSSRISPPAKTFGAVTSFSSSSVSRGKRWVFCRSKDSLVCVGVSCAQSRRSNWWMSCSVWRRSMVILDSGGSPRDVCGPYRMSYPSVGAKCRYPLAGSEFVSANATGARVSLFCLGGGSSYSPRRMVVCCVRPAARAPARRARMCWVVQKTRSVYSNKCMVSVVVDGREEKTAVFPYCFILRLPRQVVWPCVPCGPVRP